MNSSAELHSGWLQFPDDENGSYRKKNSHQSKAQSVNAVETYNTDNAINLITDVCVEGNNVEQ